MATADVYLSVTGKCGYVALYAAELLRQQYETVFKEEMKYAPLEDMILTALVM
ncbi:MAG: hypothetical protein AABX60_02430 [Nanoarchaeota archaeon]